MSHWRTVLCCRTSVWGDGIRHLLEKEADFELLATIPFEEDALARVAALRPDIIFVAGEEMEQESCAWVGRLIDMFPDVPIVLLSITRSDVQVIQTRKLPLRWDGLLSNMRRHLEEVSGRHEAA